MKLSKSLTGKSKKIMLRHTISKLLKTEYKGIIIKANREKKKKQIEKQYHYIPTAKIKRTDHIKHS